MQENRSRLTDGMVSQAMELREQGFSYQHIADLLGFSCPYIYRVLKGLRYKCWQHQKRKAFSSKRKSKKEIVIDHQETEVMFMCNDSLPNDFILNAITSLRRGEAGYRVIKGQIVYTLNGVIVNVAEIMRDAQQMGYQRGGTVRYEGNERSLITNSEEKFRAAIARSKTPIESV